MIHQGDVYWVDFGKPTGSEPGYLRPYVVLQNDVFNRSLINTVVVCALTSNLDLARAPGNVALRKKEAGLPKKSVVNVSQIMTADKAMLTKKTGTLSQQRVMEILEGVSKVIGPRDVESE